MKKLLYLHQPQPELVMSLGALLQAMDLDLARVYSYPDSGTSLSVDLEIVPEEFLEFAENDLIKGDKQGLVNALTNAKRAIDGQIDKTFTCFGLQKRRNFPQKLSILQEMGLLAPRIVNKVVSSRNLLEHQYKIPERNFVEDAVDIANLFVFALNSVLLDFTDAFFIGTYLKDKGKIQGRPILDKEIHVEFFEDEHEFFLSGYELDSEDLDDVVHHMKHQKEKKQVGQVILAADDLGYPQMIGIASRVWHYDITSNLAKLMEKVSGK